MTDCGPVNTASVTCLFHDFMMNLYGEANLYNSLQCRRILGGQKLLVYVSIIVVTTIFDFMIKED